jgi:2,3-bisphosphoglycerate-independent phosphoglycerate mutase
MLIILDGWGISTAKEGNAITTAKTPFLDGLKKDYPSTQLLCSGEAVGLPKGIMGNSEVGHLNIGAGRVVYQDLLRIDQAISQGEFYNNKILNSVMSKVNSNDSALHLMGLVSDGGVHSHLEHLFALLQMAREKSVKRAYIHAILDGRDTSPDSGAGYIEKVQQYINDHHFGTIATICGRFYAMDRDNRWDRVEKAYQLYTQGKGTCASDSVQAVKSAYQREETDEFVLPVVMTDQNEKPLGLLQDNDGVIFFNFRADRARQITRAIADPNFDSFKRNVCPKPCEYVCMTMYDEKFSLPMAFPPIHLKEILGEVISKKGLNQLRIAETEKYAHVTYFFNGGEEKPFPLEDRCLIPSPREVSTYDLKPEMNAYPVTKEVLVRLKSKKYEALILNFANMDMVGHTGVLDAAIKAAEAIDECVEQIVNEVKRQGGMVMLTADHGNSEQMIADNGNPHTAHTLNPVPFILVDDSRRRSRLKPGRLCDIAPTILHLMGIDQPERMTGKSLLDA